MNTSNAGHTPNALTQDALSADKPVADPTGDRLGYAPFAEHLARSITAMAPPEGLVIALYGPWGSGKSTVLGFVEHYLDRLPKSERPVMVHFNPWWFSGHVDLTEKFFSQLELAVGRKKSFEKLRQGIAGLATTVSKAKGVVPYAGAGEALASLLQPPTKDVLHLKEEIGRFLLDKKIRVLVIVDDIDRLTSAEEIRQVFRVVKAVADFPNAVYLLAFDKDIVTQALEQAPAVPGSGEAFLEKIVQVPFELPLPDKPALRLMLSERLEAILAGTPGSLFNQTDWVNTYHDGIDHFMATPRDVVRLTNALLVTYPAVRGEVNPVDFVALETLRVARPSVYDTIRRNPEMFAGHTDTMLSSGTPDRLKRFHESWLKEKVPAVDQEAVKSLVVRLFPKTKNVWNNMGYGPDWESRWRRDLRVCSPDIFPTFFKLSLTAGTLSRQELDDLLALGSDSTAFAARLLEITAESTPATAASSRIWHALERLQDFTEDVIPTENIAPIMTALFNVGDAVVNTQPEGRGAFGFGIGILFGRLFFQLMRRLPEPERFELIKTVFTKGKAVGLIVDQIATLGQQHGKLGGDSSTPEGQRIVSSSHLAELERIGLRRIEILAAKGSLMETKSVLSMLYRWADWDEDSKPRKWIGLFVQTDEGLLALLEKALGTSRSQTIGDAAVTTHLTLDPAVLEPFLPADSIIGRARALAARDGLPERQQAAVRQFVKEYDKRQARVDPLLALDQK